ncbi:MAG TPA: CHASE domain-containing protein, partial [Bdellovibrio sp.]
MRKSSTLGSSLKNYLWYSAQVVIFALIYFGVALLGLKFATINNNASPIWPASGIAVSILFFCGRKYFPAVFIGAFLANYGTQIPLNTIALISLGNMLEAVCAASLLRRFRFSSVLPSDIYTGILKYLSVALGPTAISATIGTLALLLHGTLDFRSLPANWLTWWLGDCLGFLLIFPLLHEMRKWRQDLPLVTRPREDFWYYFKVTARLGFATLCVIAATHFVFAVPSGYPYLFIIFFSFLLVTHLSPSWGVYLAAIYASVLSIFKTNEGLGPFWSGLRNDSIIHLEFFLGAVWITAIVLCSLKKTHTLKRPSWAFSVGWLLTGATFYAFFQTNMKEARIYYEGKAGEAATIVEETMNGYTRLLESGVSLLKIDPHMSVQKWKTYIDNLRLVEKYPGLKGMGIIYRVPHSSRTEFLKKTRQEIADFSIHDVTNESNIQDESYIITYLEPLELNRPALGLDISTEAHRLEALLRARDSGEAALTQSIHLKQSSRYGMGYLLLVPFYSGEHAPRTLEERRKKIAGFVYAPIEAGAFFDAATKVYASELRWLHPEDGANHKEHLIYTEMDLVDNKQTIAWEPASKAKILSNVEASMAGFSGAFVTVVLAILVAGLENISFQAQKLADKKTEEVEERERLWRALAEMSPIGIFQTDSVG